MIFDPSLMPSGPRRRTSYSDGDFLVLQCSHEACGKWRRVDVPTYDMFWNDWMQAQREKRSTALVALDPSLCSDLHIWLREQVAEHFKSSPRARKPRLPFLLTLQAVQSYSATSEERAQLYTTHERAFLEVFLQEVQHFLLTPFAQAYKLESSHADMASFEGQIASLPAEDNPTPKFLSLIHI